MTVAHRFLTNVHAHLTTLLAGHVGVRTGSNLITQGYLGAFVPTPSSYSPENQPDGAGAVFW